MHSVCRVSPETQHVQGRALSDTERMLPNQQFIRPKPSLTMINGEMEKSRGPLSKNYFFIKVEDLVRVYNSDASRELDPNKAETKILVYEDRVNVWFLDVIDEMKDDPDAGLLVLQSLTNLLDNNAKLTGSGGASATIKKLFKTDTDWVAGVRSGKPSGIRFDLHSPAVKKTETGLVINPSKFADAVRLEITRCIKSLRSNKTFARNFKLF